MHDRNFLIIECRSEKETDQQTMWVRIDNEKRNETFAFFFDELRSIFLSFAFLFSALPPVFFLGRLFAPLSSCSGNFFFEFRLIQVWETRRLRQRVCVSVCAPPETERVIVKIQ